MRCDAREFSRRIQLERSHPREFAGSGRKIRETKIDEKNKGHWTKRSWRKNIARTYLLSTARESLCTCARREKNIPHPDPLSRPTEQSNVQSLENFISEEYADDSRTGGPYVGIDIALDRFREFRSLQGQGDQREEGYLHQEGYPQSPRRENRADRGEESPRQSGGRAGKGASESRRGILEKRKNPRISRTRSEKIAHRYPVPLISRVTQERKIERSVPPHHRWRSCRVPARRALRAMPVR
ncbi:hypothetical protein HN011_010923 [Eciton burchellii]|nr:hypothetical protein HN011_010923 [Eciton burchellii]